MCGIIALLRAPGARQLLPASDVLGRLDAIQRGLLSTDDRVEAAEVAAAALEDLDRLLRDPDGVALLVREPAVATRVTAVCVAIGDWITATEAALDASGSDGVHPLERVNAAVLRLKDARWAVERDRVPTALGVRELVGAAAGWSAIEIGTSIQQALSALDRLEVRGRDSAGITILVHDHGLDLGDPAIARLIGVRAADPLFRTNAVRTPEGHLSFVYKAAAEIGELGDNTAAMRADIIADDLLRLALGGRARRRARPRAHPLGQHRDHLPAQRPPGGQPGARSRRRALRHRGAER